MRRANGLGVWWMFASVVFATACTGDDWYSPLWSAESVSATKPALPRSRPKRERPKGDFISADPYGSEAQNGKGVRSGGGGFSATADSSSATSAVPASAGPSVAAAPATRAVERGDLFRVLPEGRVLSLNPYRGVHIIDIRDLNAPRVDGRVALSGWPVELYVLGDRALVLVNASQAYYGSRTDIPGRDAGGGVVLSLDLSNRTRPVITSRAAIGGEIITSRLTQGGGQAALYVAAVDSTTGGAFVKSFDVSAAALTPKTELSLGGYVQDVQATNELLMVASNDYTVDQGRSRVSLVDISRPDGTMVLGGSVLASGYVRSKFNMDAYQGVLRIVSESSRVGFGFPRPVAPVSAAGGGVAKPPASTKHQLETFSLADLQQPQPIDGCEFGEVDPETGQLDSLFASLFLDNRAFFVTYLRQDPFHAFSVDAAGYCEEHNEFIVSGWNDFFRATLGGTRLIGIGHNDVADSRKLSVSLYDAVNLKNPTPLLARSEIDLSSAYSIANWDDLGFSVLEGAVSVSAADGTLETGLLLLPFEGYDEATQQYVARVQLFTFSDHTLTRRGAMEHGSSVRRSFAVSSRTTANLSDDQLSLFDTQNPDAPVAQGRLELAPNYSRLFVFGDYVARVKSRTDWFAVGDMEDRIDILARDGDLDTGEVLATFHVPLGATLIQVGDLLVSASSELANEAAAGSGSFVPEFQTTLKVYDLSDPRSPRARGVLETDRIGPSYYGGRPWIDCFGAKCGGFSGDLSQHFTVGRAIAFAHIESHQRSLGNVHVCDRYLDWECAPDSGDAGTCLPPPYQGGITCTTRAGAAEECYGDFYECTPEGACEPTAEVPSEIVESCYDYEEFEYWSSYAFDTLDLRDADQPSLAPRLELPSDEAASSVVAAGTTLYYNFSEPFEVANDDRSYVKKYVRELRFEDPLAPTSGPAINIPGDVIAVDGEALLTRDWVWRRNVAHTSIARVTLADGQATLDAQRIFADQSVNNMLLDGTGHVLVTSDPAYNEARVEPVIEPQTTLQVLSAQTLETTGRADVDSWAGLRAVAGGRALFDVSGGLLVFDVRDASDPRAQAYFPLIGWANDLHFDGSEIILAAGAHGVFRFDATQSNLTPQ